MSAHFSGGGGTVCIRNSRKIDGGEGREHMRMNIFKWLHRRKRNQEKHTNCEQWIFFFPPFLATPQPMESQGQRSDPSHSPDPSRGCSNAGSLTHCAGPGIKPASQRSQDAANPILNSGWFLNSGYSSEERRQSQLLVTFLWGLFTFFTIYISILLRVFSNEHEK